MGQTSNPPAAGRVLGLDLGDARIGVAVSDPDRRLAVPHGTIRVGQPPGELRAVAALVEELDIGVVVVGLPLSLSGEDGPAADHARGFTDALRAAVPVPVSLHDERLSTVEAEARLRSAGIKGQDRRRVVDQTAATVILQSWLDMQG